MAGRGALGPFADVVRDDEMLDMVDPIRLIVMERPNAMMVASIRRHRKQPVVPHLFAALRLLCLDPTKQGGTDKASGADRHIHLHQDVERLAIATE